MEKADTAQQDPATSIWLFAGGYFLAYAPYTALAKALTSGQLGAVPALSGLQILPLSTFASLLGMLAFLTWKGWWRFAHQRPLFSRHWPSPTLPTLLSGLATAAIIATTTLSYTFARTSILMMMLLMRGGVLVLAPVVDLFSKRAVRWQSWLGLVLSVTALIVALGDGDTQVELLGVIVVTVYLAAYFIRLRLMSRFAKSDDASLGRKFFVEEQMVATPAIVLFLILMATIGASDSMLEVRNGFFDLGSPLGAVVVLAIGVFSQFTGIFGALVLLDARENAFCVPVNRASSVLAGVVASAALWAFLGGRPVPIREMIGASLLVIAIVVLALAGVPRSARVSPGPR